MATKTKAAVKAKVPDVRPERGTWRKEASHWAMKWSDAALGVAILSHSTLHQSTRIAELEAENDELVKDKARLVENAAHWGSRAKFYADLWYAATRPWYFRLYRWAVKMWEGMHG